MTDVSNVIVISEGTAPVQLYLYLYRSLFDGVELCRNCSCVVDQALVHGMHHKEKAPTQANLE